MRHLFSALLLTSLFTIGCGPAPSVISETVTPEEEFRLAEEQKSVEAAEREHHQKVFARSGG